MIGGYRWHVPSSTLHVSCQYKQEPHLISALPQFVGVTTSTGVELSTTLSGFSSRFLLNTTPPWTHSPHIVFMRTCGCPLSVGGYLRQISSSLSQYRHVPHLERGSLQTPMSTIKLPFRCIDHLLSLDFRRTAD